MNTLKKGLVGLLIGAGAMFSHVKATNMPDEKIVRYVAQVQKYIEDKGYTVGISGINGVKDFIIDVDNTLRNDADTLEPKISIMPTSDTLPLDKWLLMYDEYDGDDFKTITEQNGMYFEVIGMEGSVANILDRYFVKKSVAIEKVVDTDKTVLDANPNPYNSTVNVNFSLSSHAKVSLGVYDVAGKLVNKLFDGNSSSQSVVWDSKDFSGKQVSTGTYLLRLTADDKRYVKRVNLTK
jgi:hypothetical protein